MQQSPWAIPTLYYFSNRVAFLLKGVTAVFIRSGKLRVDISALSRTVVVLSTAVSAFPLCSLGAGTMIGMEMA